MDKQAPSPFSAQIKKSSPKLYLQTCYSNKTKASLSSKHRAFNSTKHSQYTSQSSLPSKKATDSLNEPMSNYINSGNHIHNIANCLLTKNDKSLFKANMKIAGLGLCKVRLTIRNGKDLMFIVESNLTTRQVHYLIFEEWSVIERIKLKYGTYEQMVKDLKYDQCKDVLVFQQSFNYRAFSIESTKWSNLNIRKNTKAEDKLSSQYSSIQTVQVESQKKIGLKSLNENNATRYNTIKKSTIDNSKDDEIIINAFDTHKSQRNQLKSSINPSRSSLFTLGQCSMGFIKKCNQWKGLAWFKNSKSYINSTQSKTKLKELKYSQENNEESHNKVFSEGIEAFITKDRMKTIPINNETAINKDKGKAQKANHSISKEYKGACCVKSKEERVIVLEVKKLRRIREMMNRKRAIQKIQQEREASKHSEITLDVDKAEQDPKHELIEKDSEALLKDEAAKPHHVIDKTLVMIRDQIASKELYVNDWEDDIRERIKIY